MSALTETFARFNVSFDTAALVRGIQEAQRATAALENLDSTVKRVARDEDLFAAATRRAVIAQGQIAKQAQAQAANRGGGGGGVALMLAGLGGAVTAARGALSAISHVTAGVRHLINEQRILAESLDDTSQRLGINATDLQAWRLAANLAGISSEQLDAALLRLSGQIANRGSSASKALRTLGVSTRGANGEIRDLGAILGDAAEPLSRLSVADRNARLIQLLGRGGARLGPLFARGAAGIAEARRELQRLGGGVSPEARRNLAALGDQMDRLEVAETSVKAALAGALAPALGTLIDWFSRAAGIIANVTRNSHLLNRAIQILKYGLIAFAVATSFIWGPIVIGMGLALLAAIALYLVIDDIVTAFEGGRSVSAAFWNSIVQGLEDAINAVRDFFGLDAIRIGARFANGGNGTSSTPLAETEGRAIKTVPKARGAGGNVTVTQSTNVTVQAQTNADPQAIGAEVDRRLRQRDQEAVESLSTAGGVVL